MGDLTRLLDESTFAILCVPLTDDTHGLIGEAELLALGPEGYLVNVCRGPVVEEQALFDALDSRGIAGAALDVWYRYPAEGRRTRLSGLASVLGAGQRRDDAAFVGLDGEHTGRPVALHRRADPTSRRGLAARERRVHGRLARRGTSPSESANASSTAFADAVSAGAGARKCVSSATPRRARTYSRTRCSGRCPGSRRPSREETRYRAAPHEPGRRRPQRRGWRPGGRSPRGPAPGRPRRLACIRGCACRRCLRTPRSRRPAPPATSRDHPDRSRASRTRRSVSSRPAGGRTPGPSATPRYSGASWIITGISALSATREKKRATRRAKGARSPAEPRRLP